MEDKPRLSKKLKRGGQKIKHGGYSFLVKGELPENRKYVLRYLTAARENLIQDLGPTEQDLTAAQIILIDRVITKLGIVRCIEEHIRETSVMQGHNLAPSLRQSYLAYNNSIRLDLQSLGINKRAESIIDPIKYIQGDSQGDDDNKRGE
jgi:hypothetical protein